MPETAPNTVLPSLSPAQSPRLEAESLWQNPLAPELRESEQLSVGERNAWLDRALDDDPSRPLPVISLDPVENLPPMKPVNGGIPNVRLEVPHAETTKFVVHSPDGERVGFAVLNRPTEPAFYGGSDKYFIGWIGIFDDARDEGYGPASYLAILKSLPRGSGMRTEGVVSYDAKSVWNKLVAKGIARQIGSEERPPTAYETVF